MMYGWYFYIEVMTPHSMTKEYCIRRQQTNKLYCCFVFVTYYHKSSYNILIYRYIISYIGQQPTMLCVPGLNRSGLVNGEPVMQATFSSMSSTLLSADSLIILMDTAFLSGYGASQIVSFIQKASSNVVCKTAANLTSLRKVKNS